MMDEKVEKSFDDFAVGQSNRIAYSAAITVAKSPYGTYNPLFMYGLPGSGKTHLLKAITEYVKKQNPEMKIVYLTSTEFSNLSSTNKKKLEDADILLIDDIQFLTERAQEDFFYLFNRLYNARKQIVVGSDRPPRDLYLSDTLTSRFEWGLVVELQPPDFETRTEILKKKSEKMKIYMPIDVIRFVSENVKSPDLLDVCFNSIVMKSRENITIDIAKKVLSEISTEIPPTVISPKEAEVSEPPTLPQPPLQPPVQPPQPPRPKPISEPKEKRFISRLREVLRKPKKVEKVVVKPKKKPGPPTVLLPPHIKELEFKVVKEPHAYVRIVYDHQLHEHRYIVMEPDLSDSERKLYDMLKDIFARTLAYTFEKEDGIKAEDYLRKTVDNLLTSHMIEIEHEVKEKILYYVIRDFIGYGKIDVLMRDEAIEDISCDGPKVPIFLYHRVYESIETNIVFDTEDELDSFVIKLAQRCGKLITALNPMVDATMPDGSRLQATLAREVTTGGSSFTIRKFRADPLTPPDLVDLNTMSPEMVAYLWLAIQHGKSILFCGGTASGKTTTLNAMSIFIPSKAKIVSIEDTREINLPHKNWIASVTRGSFGGVEKKDKTETEIDMFDLMKAALRQRPQYIIVGEVRGREAFTMFQAMATGHATFSTLHADSIQSMIYRLEHPPINLPRVLMGSLNIIVIQLLTKIGDKTVRRIGNIYEIVGLAPENMELLVNEVYRWVPETDRFIYTGKSVILEEIKQTSNIDDEELWENIRQRIDIITWLRKKRKRHVSEVGEIVSGYYKEPANIIEKVRGDLYGS